MTLTALRLEPDRPGDPGRLLVRLGGDVDLARRDHLDRWRRTLPHPVALHLDLADLRFAGAAFVGFLVALDRDVEAGGGRFTLGPVPRPVLRVLTVCGVAERFACRTGERHRPPRPEPAPASDR